MTDHDESTVASDSTPVGVDTEAGDTSKSASKPAGHAAFCEKVRSVLPGAVAESLSDDERLANALYSRALTHKKCA